MRLVNVINLWRLSTWPMSMNDCSGGRNWGRYSVRKHSMCQRWLLKILVILKIHLSPWSPPIKPVIAGDEQVWVCTKNAKLVRSWAGLRHQLPWRAAPSFQGLIIWEICLSLTNVWCCRCATALPMWAAQGWASIWWGGSWGTPLPSSRGGAGKKSLKEQ